MISCNIYSHILIFLHYQTIILLKEPTFLKWILNEGKWIPNEEKWIPIPKLKLHLKDYKWHVWIFHLKMVASLSLFSLAPKDANRHCSKGFYIQTGFTCMLHSLSYPCSKHWAPIHWASCFKNMPGALSGRHK